MSECTAVRLDRPKHAGKLTHLTRQVYEARSAEWRRSAKAAECPGRLYHRPQHRRRIVVRMHFKEVELIRRAVVVHHSEVSLPSLRAYLKKNAVHELSGR